ncbi:MAG: UDP-N-acetylmuramoyl-tripeptide--D-alanyl-D-alanine ligase [Candidatus Omnitrophica bacterium]|nr:UDP-N-acetylmuramoyl-tripeptide--D-alanyl-D-alanine ligase [Candidatus Omnitrophota bacterium]
MNEALTFTAREILSAAGAKPEGLSGPDVRGISIDTRTIKPGELFVAIRGKRFDGHDFIPEAFQRGAAAALVDGREIRAPGCLYRAADTLKALGDLARFHRDRFNLPVAAITGSSGKTTTKEMTRHLLSAKAEVLAAPGTQNNQVGVPLTLFRLTAEPWAAVLELGTNQWGEIGRLTEISRPTVGVCLNIGRAHLKTFGDLAGVLRAKGELWEKLDSGAGLVLNADDPLLWETGRRLNRRILWFGCRPEADVRADRIAEEGWTTRARINGKWKLALPLPGRHNLMNALAALTCAQALGMDLQPCLERLSSMAPIPGRLAAREVEGCLFLDDTYNANPDSFHAALEVLKAIPASGRRVVVCGDMLEQGKAAAGLHAELGRRIAASGVEALAAVGPRGGDLVEAARQEGLPPEKSWRFKSAWEAGEFLLGFLKAGDVVLVKGSRGMKMEEVLECFCTSLPR